MPEVAVVAGAAVPGAAVVTATVVSAAAVDDATTVVPSVTGAPLELSTGLVEEGAAVEVVGTPYFRQLSNRS